MRPFHRSGLREKIAVEILQGGPRFQMTSKFDFNNSPLYVKSVFIKV